MWMFNRESSHSADLCRLRYANTKMWLVYIFVCNMNGYVYYVMTSHEQRESVVQEMSAYIVDVLVKYT